MRNIVLVGFMGTGKTTVGRELAKKLGMEFIDLDDVIEDAEQMKIPEIFKAKGETYFREAEKRAVRQVCAKKDLIVAAGGGVVLCEENIAALCASSIVVCLDASPEVILQRTSGHAHRPLLNVDDPLVKIKDLLAKRKTYYDKISDHIDTSGRSAEEVVALMMELISKKINASAKDHP
jgi:shikimate kinase